MPHPPNYRRQPPLATKLFMSWMAPRDLEHEMVENFERKYVEFAVPEFHMWAPLWAWGQVIRTLIFRIKDAALEVLERIRITTSE